jgi:N-acetylmuramate 1-kinase
MITPDSNTPTERSVLRQQFIQQHASAFGLKPASLTVASADASFRHYFRIQGAPVNESTGATQAKGAAAVAAAVSQGADTHYILMDAPPAQEDCRPFVHVAGLLQGAGLNVPTVLAQDLEHGFLLLKDLGNTTYLSALQGGGDHRPLYADAITALVSLQAASRADALPAYDTAKLKTEMDLFETWYLTEHHGINLNDRERALLQVALHLINQACTSQAAVWVHRDYHCRNLMVTPQGNPGVLDFQDAVHGPYTYDLVSLLRDAYIDWPEEAQIELAVDYWQKAKAAGVPVPADFGELWRDMEWMGLQRHLKVLGIFARLYHRDGKDGYLKDIPLVLQYAQRTAQRYDGLGILVRLFDRVQGVERKAGVTF